ncbi:hypothetical protein I7I53_08777 [Histoplasma capsulatum var. duboisii H88]|uniref:Uncharacterized protein n=1 Tax=Ajellomyces capsulatus (strain H88) TaxID=544711 RepID=A0A8A1L7J6_AJEC8|nr:hypothetical protein I7I53_08777 [Histoplasma capsulatum var. duboisii H88]
MIYHRIRYMIYRRIRYVIYHRISSPTQVFFQFFGLFCRGDLHGDWDIAARTADEGRDVFDSILVSCIEGVSQASLALSALPLMILLVTR